MPLFDFRCPACGHTFERLVRASDAAQAVTTECAQCGQPGATRQVSAPARQPGSGGSSASAAACVPRSGFT